MSDPILWAPTPQNLDAHVVGRPIGATEVGRLATEAAHLLGYETQTIVDTILPPHTVTPASIVFGYTRNPGVQTVKAVVELWVATIDSHLTLALSTSAGVLAFMYPTEPSAPSPLHGLTNAYTPSYNVLGQAQTFEEIIDVSGLPVGVKVDLTLLMTTGSGSPQGVRRFALFEVPVGSSAVFTNPATEVGVASSWAYSGHPIDSDGLATATGFARLEREVERARTQNLRQFNINFWENTTGAIQRTNINFGALTYPAGLASPNLKMRVQRHFETTTPAPHQGAFRCWVTGGGNASIRLLVDGVVVQTWVGIVNGAVAETAFANFNVPTNTALQYTRWSLEAKASAGTLFISRFYGIEMPT